MRYSPSKLLVPVAVALLSGIAALSAEAAGADEDPPARVARLSYLKGDVAMQAADDDDDRWTDASVNRPLTTGDRLKLERNARAELQIGELDAHLDEATDFSFLELNDDVAQIRLSDGAVHLSVRRLRDDEVIEVDTPQAAVTIKRPGEYSIAVRDNGIRTTVKTYSGACEVNDHRGTLALKGGEQANFFAAELNASAAAVQPIESRNAFDDWAHERNLGYERSVSSRYVAPDVIGYRDLDDYGDWVEESDYGYVWYPRHVAVEWSPYRFGHWVWIAPWGWTWVDDAPWGFAPFHYGRWANVRGRWCWVPGPRHAHPVYAPALVAWVGAPPPRGVHVSVSFGAGIGWFPLAPREIFVPGYRCSRTHLHNINYSNTVIVSNVYINRVYSNRSTYFDHANRHVRGAITVVRPDAFAASRPVREHIVRVEPRELDHWRTRNFVSDVHPVRSELPTRRIVDRSPPREVLTHRTPPAHAFARTAPSALREHIETAPRHSPRAQNQPNTRIETRERNRSPTTPTQADLRPTPREFRREATVEPRHEVTPATRSPEVMSVPRIERRESRPSEPRASLPDFNRAPNPRSREFERREPQPHIAAPRATPDRLESPRVESRQPAPQRQYEDRARNFRSGDRRSLQN